MKIPKLEDDNYVITNKNHRLAFDDLVNLIADDSNISQSTVVKSTLTGDLPAGTPFYRYIDEKEVQEVNYNFDDWSCKKSGSFILKCGTKVKFSYQKKLNSHDYFELKLNRAYPKE